MSTAYHPQTDGQTERMNRTLEEMLRAYTTYHQNKWDEHLSAAEFAYNNSKQASTEMTPFELDIGQHPVTPLELANNTTKVEAAENLYTTWKNNLQIAKDTLLIAQERQTKYANQHRQDETYNIGNQVLLSTTNINDDINKNHPTRKLSPKWIDLYPIEEVISSTVYKLTLPKTMKIHPVFHVSLIKPYRTTNEFEREIPPPPININNDEDEHDEYIVESILDMKMKHKKKFYLIKWKGYPLYDATWESESNLTNCHEALQKFLNQ